MFKDIKSLVNRIADMGNGGREGSGDQNPKKFDSDHHSAEGFLCPQCMMAFSSPEELESHYNIEHFETFHEASGNQELENGAVHQLTDDMRDMRGLNKSQMLRMPTAEETLFKKELEILKEQIKGDQDRILTLLSEKGKIEDMLRSLNIENNDLRQKLIQRDTLEQKSEGADIAENEIVIELQKRLGDLEVRLAAKEEEIKGFIKSLEANVKLQEETTKEIDSYKEASSFYKTKTQELMDKGEKLSIELEAALSENASKNRDLASLQENNDKRLDEANKICWCLKEEIERLEEQKKELLRKFEGEDLKGALEELQNDNRIYRTNLELSQNLNKELQNNVHNLEIKLEKSLNEYKVLHEAHEAEKEQSMEKALLFNEQINRKELEKQTIMKNKEEEHIIALKIRDNKVQSMESSLERLKKDVEGLNFIIEQNQNESIRLKDERLALSEQMNSLDIRLQNEEQLRIEGNKLKESLMKENEELNLQLEEKSKDHGTLKQNYESSQSELKKLTQNFNSLEESKTGEILKMNKEMDSIKENLMEKESSLKNKEKEICELKITIEEKVQKVKETIDLYNKVKGELESIGKVWSESKVELEEMRSKLSLVQIESVKNKEEISDLTKKCEEEKAILLERILNSDSEREKAENLVKEARRKLEDNMAALHELGRENQSLQLESAKKEGRKWLDDSLVNICGTCFKEFSLTIRKHHCRHCGNIFCNDCSSQSASIPSSKKPVRVCDACYQELTSK